MGVSVESGNKSGKKSLNADLNLVVAGREGGGQQQY